MAGEAGGGTRELTLRRTGEMAAIFMIGDGLLGLLQPSRHVALWRSDVTAADALVRPFASRPGRRRAYGLLQIGAGCCSPRDSVADALGGPARRAQDAAMFTPDPIGLPGVVALAIGYALFLAAVLAARATRAHDAGERGAIAAR